jgi:hypothetical protein
LPPSECLDEDEVRMTGTTDRREDERGKSEELSPEYLAVLVVCGGTVRETDWEHLPESLAARRHGPPLGEEASAETSEPSASR